MQNLPTFFLVVLLITTAVALDATSQEPHPRKEMQSAPAALAPQPSPQDRSFLEMFITASHAEMELGELAAAKARHPELRALARQMASDSKAAASRLAALVAPLKLAPLPDAPDAEHRAMAHQLEQAEPADFDQLYIDGQVRDHEDQISILEMQVSSGEQGELKKFAADILPMVREHLQRATRISEALKTEQ